MNSDRIASHVAESADAIVVARADGQIVMSNGAAQELFGYSAEELLNAGVETLIPPASRAIHRRHRQDFALDPSPRLQGKRTGPLVARRSDGSVFHAEISLSPAGSGTDATVMAVVRDVSERLAFDSESEMVRQSLDSISEAVFMFDADTLEFCYVNSGATAQTGYSRSELLDGMTPLSIKPAYNHETFTALIGPLLNEEQTVVTFETAHRTRDGGNVPVEVMLQKPKALASGKVCLMALVRDISVRLSQHERLVNSEQAFRSAFEDAPVGMAIADLSTPEKRVIVSANAALGNMLGYHQADLIGKTFESLTHQGDHEQDRIGAADLKEHRIAKYQAEKRYIHAEGHTVWTELSAVRLAGPEGVRSLAHIVDTTRRVQVEAERDQRELFLSFLGDIRLAVLSESPIPEVMELILSTARTALNAGDALIAMPDPSGQLRISVRDGWPDLGEPGTELPENWPEIRSRTEAGLAVSSPLSAGPNPSGILIVGRSSGAEKFSPGDIAFVQALADEGAVALEFQRARDERTKLKLSEDRERIARELQDRVIQHLFAVGMSLQANLESPDRLKDAVEAAIQDLDSSIAVVRDSIFNLESRRPE